MTKLINRQFSWLAASVNLHISTKKCRLGLGGSPTISELLIPIFRKLVETP